MKNIQSLPEQSGIYMVTNLINQKKYIGQSKNIKQRFERHHLYDYNNENNCCYNTKFYQALRKYGLDNFEVEVLELCTLEQLDDLEIQYIKKFNSFEEGYNSTEGGQNWSPNIHSEETEQKRKITRELNQSLQNENHPRAKLTNEEVIKIRQRYINGESVKQIYEDYKTLYQSEEVVKKIIFGQTYSTVGNIPNKEQIRYTNAKLTTDQIRMIRKSYIKGQTTYKEIGEQYGVSENTIMRIIKRQTYKNVD